MICLITSGCSGRVPAARRTWELEAAFLFTLKFDAGNWKIVKTHQMSEKEVEEGGKEQ